MSTIELKQNPKLVQQQKLYLTQEQQLFLRLIQMSSLELREYVEEQLEENPALEEDLEKKPKEDSQSENENSEDLNFDSYKFDAENSIPFTNKTFHDQDQDFSWENNLTSETSLQDYLRWQLKISNFEEDEKLIASVIIGNTDEDGYLNSKNDEILAEFLHLSDTENKDEFKNGFILNSLTDEQLQKGLAKVKNVLDEIHLSFDPVGVCARDLKECLKLQAYNLGFRDEDLILVLIDQYLEEISNSEYEKIALETSKEVDEIGENINIISSFEPKPGRPYYMSDIEKNITPDYHVYKIGDELQIQFKVNIPNLRISQYYQKIIRNSESMNPETKKYIKEKLDLAKKVIKGIQEREIAITKVIKKIVNIQRDYFFYGKDFIKPLKLKDIADDEDINVHESTISRMTSKRYISTPNGIIPMRTLFSRKIETVHGTDISYDRVKSIIEDLIKNEDNQSPYSDEDISKVLEIRNIKLARRTVAKYRKLLEIPSSSKRAKNYKEEKSGA
ncbi:MAG: RNA polymerase factor sigma-54 [Candidatus Dadabacteria bacterium]|nr:RNA polymerase factor sigma-54 [Candidatus Dadabacteria bacterium]NIS07246.1 RNA polymerase factor sigma-54 [Candidatus Dadabacteria bacterium]NIV40953.1 RNA polymerase factor sigma-54 [Candidatus Dadabacteria bacterium]NIX14385.1 RNA polymerase factor sigma-54 [Candidatus Dadabacteria bacterium]NIY20903.1 RNA polymerase factor sigma-54 [Candidatus Dadabacteria bacterium]